MQLTYISPEMDDVDEFERKLTRTNAKRNYAIAGILVAAAAGFIGFNIYSESARNERGEAAYEQEKSEQQEARREGARTPAERAALTAQIDKLAGDADALDTAFHAALVAAFAALPDETGECPISGIRVAYQATAPVGPLAFAVAIRAALAEARTALADGFYPDALRALPDAHDAQRRYEMVVDVKQRVHAKVMRHVFQRGSITGNAVLWDSLERRVVCAARDVTAYNSDSIHYDATVVHNEFGPDFEADNGQIDATLERDIAAQMQTAVWPAFRAAR